MSYFMNAINWYAALPSTVMIMIGIFLIGLVLARLKPMNALKSVSYTHLVFHQHGKRDVTAVENMSFSLRAGEILGIVGESGSGKSTVCLLYTSRCV